MELSAITNGYDLEAFPDILSKFNFTYLQVTIDGVGELNNRLRIHKNGGDTYERILANVERVLECGVGIDLRINVGSENLHGIKDLIADLTTRGFIDKEKARAEEEKRLKETNLDAKTRRGRFYYYFKTVDDYFKNQPEKKLSEQAVIDELVKAGVSLQDAVGHQNQYNSAAAILFNLLKKNSFIDFDPAFCSAVTGMLFVDPFGRLYPCYDFVNKAEMEVGFVDVKHGRFVTNFDWAKWQTRTADLLEKCQACPYCFICRGGCAGRASFYCGNWRQEYCGEHKEVFNFVASRLAGNFWQKNHEEEMSLSLAETLSGLSQNEREIFMTSNNRKELFELAKKTGIFSTEFKAG